METALQQSIRRKKELVKELNPILKDKDLEYSHNDIRYTISILENEITEDEKLLALEEEQMRDVASFWWEAGQIRIEVDFNKWLAETFKND